MSTVCSTSVVAPAETRTLSALADVNDLDGVSRDGCQRDGGANGLTTALSLRAVDLDHSPRLGRLTPCDCASKRAGTYEISVDKEV